VKTLCPLWNLWFSIQLRFGLVLLCINSITCNRVIRQSNTQKWFRKQFEIVDEEIKEPLTIYQEWNNGY